MSAANGKTSLFFSLSYRKIMGADGTPLHAPALSVIQDINRAGRVRNLTVRGLVDRLIDQTQAYFSLAFPYPQDDGEASVIKVDVPSEHLERAKRLLGQIKGVSNIADTREAACPMPPVSKVPVRPPAAGCIANGLVQFVCR